MAQAWLSVEEAALTLGISVRTLHRRLARDEIQTRLASGRREVLVDIPDSARVAQARADDDRDDHARSTTDNSTSAAGESGRVVDDRDVIDAETVSVSHGIAEGVHSTMLALHEDRLRRTDLAILAYQQSVTSAATEARRSRIAGRFGWCTAGGLVAVLFVVGVWSTHRLTNAEAAVRHLNQRLTDATQTATASADELSRIRAEAESARLLAARAEGELKAVREQPIPAADIQPAATATPTTQPVSLVDHLMRAMAQRQ